MPGLSIITLLAYDYRYAYATIRSYYDIADEIILGLDADRLTWSRKPFEVDINAVHEFIKRVDTAKKIRIIEGNFHESPHPMVNDSNERSFLAGHATAGNWVVQIDADEILLNPLEFRDWLLEHNPQDHNVYGLWVSVFKVFGNQALVVDPQTEMTPVATLSRAPYRIARMNGQPGLASPLRMLHFSWGRTPAEIAQKLENWGHSGEFDAQAYLAFWNSITLDNYSQVRNFHPLSGPTWPGLKLVSLATNEA
jgi:hypothetical protein